MSFTEARYRAAAVRTLGVTVFCMIRLEQTRLLEATEGNVLTRWTEQTKSMEGNALRTWTEQMKGYGRRKCVDEMDRTDEILGWTNITDKLCRAVFVMIG